MITDPIADYLTRLRNAVHAKHKMVEIPASNLKKEITKVLHDQGYIKQYTFEQQPHQQGSIKIGLKYNSATKTSPITKLERVSKPGRRIYLGADELPSILNGLGIAILSTSKGILSDKEARQKRVGGEILCYVY